MRYAFLLILFFLNFLQAKSQTQVPAIQYSYDDAGNRIKRKFVMVTPDGSGDGGGGQSRKMAIKDTLPEGLKVFPNPTNGIVNIDLKGYESVQLNFQVFDINGKTLMNMNSTQMHNAIDFMPYAAGTYSLVIVLNDKTIKYKILRVQ